MASTEPQRVYTPTLSIRVVDAAVPARNGEIPFALSAEVTNNNYYQADRFAAEFALWSDPHYGPAWWDNQTELMLDIRYGLDATVVSMLVGRVDHIDVDYTRGRVRVEGRDLTSNFLDHRMYGAWVNKTSSQIATELAVKYGMTADVQKTTTPVGRFYENEHDYIEEGEFTRSISEWDLMSYLAQHEGNGTQTWNVWVSGTTLHFKPAPAIDDSQPWIVQVNPPQYGHNVTALSAGVDSLRMVRAMTLAKDVIVVVRSWNAQQKRAYNVSSPKSGGSATSKTPGQKFVFTRPNLTKDQAQVFADQQRAIISQHERTIEWSDAGGNPGLLSLSPRDILELRGTQAGWDQRYYISEITRGLSVGSGLTCHVKAKNKNTESQVQSV